MHGRLELGEVLQAAVLAARENREGASASYIPELARAPLEHVSAAITTVAGEVFAAGDHADHRFTLQSTAKLILLMGMLEERGPDELFSLVGSEPTGTSFASVAELDMHGPIPSNPLVNSGAICLCGALEGDAEQKFAWIQAWTRRILGKELPVNERVLASERETGHRNRSIAFLLRSNGVLASPVQDTLEAYFRLCSLETGVVTASRLPALLARGGQDVDGKRIVSPLVAAQTIALMSTCGMYDESGHHLRQTGLPAKSGVSGVIVAVALQRAGVAVASPRLNAQGGSIRGHLILRELSAHLGWHLGLAGPDAE